MCLAAILFMLRALFLMSISRMTGKCKFIFEAAWCEVWEQQLGKCVALRLLPDLRLGMKCGDYHFHFSEGENESTDFHDLIGKAECFLLSNCGNGASNLCYLTHREDKKGHFAKLQLQKAS